MPAGTLRTRYDNVQVTLHWLTVLIVLYQFVSSLVWEEFARPTRHDLIGLHMSLGTLLGLIVLARLVWRFLPGHRVAPAVGGWQRFASVAVHDGLYLLLIAQFALGFVLRYSEARPMAFFFLQIPSPVTERAPRALHHQIGEVHEWVGYVLVALAAAHAAVALYHRFVQRDGVLQRMLPHRPGA